MSTAARRLDLVVVGGGPAGLAAANAAAQAGQQVLLIDQAPRTGGQIWRHRPGDVLPASATRLIGAVVPPRVSVATGAAVVDAISAHELIVDFGGRIAMVETSSLILATGAMELFLPFPGWTLPGVVGVGGIQALLKSGLSVADSRVVIAGTGPLIWPVAASLAKAGADVRLVGEQAGRMELLRFGAGLLAKPVTLAHAVKLRFAALGSPFHCNAWPVRANGSDRIESVTMQIGEHQREIECDWLATAAGLIPRTELGQLLGCELSGGAIAVDSNQRTTVEDVWAVGECTGVSGDHGARVEGAIAGLAAAGTRKIPGGLMRARNASRRFGARLERLCRPRSELVDRVTPATVVCRCEDVHAAALDPAWSARQARLYTRLGMGSCQGAVCGAACRTLYHHEASRVRPPLAPTQVGGWADCLSRHDPDQPSEAPSSHESPTD